MYILKQLNQFFLNTIYLSFNEWMKFNDAQNNNEWNDVSEKLNPTEQKIKDLEDKLISLWYTEKFSKNIKETLYKWLSWDPSIKNDPDAKITIEMFKKFENRYREAVTESKVTQNELEKLIKMWDKFEHTSWYNSENWEIKELKYDKEKLKIISNKEFLSLDKTDRLQYVTKNHTDFSNIANWTVNDVTFFFDQDWNGQDDSDLYRLTTLGQVMWEEVWEVRVWSVVYSRAWLDGEFFNWNNRLTIHTGTKIEIDSVRSKEDVDNIDSNNDEKVENYFNEHTEYSVEDKRNLWWIVKESFERWINPELPLIILKEIPLVHADRNIQIEGFFTQFDRLKPTIAMWDGKELEWWKYPDELVIKLLKQFTPDLWKEKAAEYWIKEESIKYIENKMYTTFDSLDLTGSLQEKTVSMIKHFEWFSEKAYFDYKQYTYWYWTKASWPEDIISEKEAHTDLLLKIESQYLPAVKRLVDINPNLWDNQIAALTSFAFNLWTGSLKNFENLIRWYPDTEDKIAAKMNLYVKAWWTKLNALVDRRITESKLFLTKNV